MTTKFNAVAIAVVLQFALVGISAASPVIITPSPLPDGAIGVAYDQTLIASNGISPYTWAIASNSLPAGLSLVASTGEITGTPVVAAVSYFGVLVTDSASQNYYSNYQMTINSAGPGLVVSPTNMVWTASNSQLWLNLSATNGILTGFSSTNIQASIGLAATNLLAGTYSDSVSFTNHTTNTGTTKRTVTLAVIYPYPSNSWVSTTSSGKWETAVNWSLVLAPSNTQSIYLTNTNTKMVAIDQTTLSNAPGSLTVHDLTVGAPGGNTNTLNLSLPASNSLLQVLSGFEVDAGGVFNLASGSVVVDQTTVGGNASNGLFVGYNTQGTMRMKGGSISIPSYPNLVTGFNPGSTGTLTIEGGTNSLPGLLIGYYSGSTGVVWMTGGAQVTSPAIGIATSLSTTTSGGSGQLIISNATVNVGQISVGGNGTVPLPGDLGTLTSLGGTLNCSGIMIIGGTAHATGTVWLADGSITVTNILSIPYYDGITMGYNGGCGVMTISNGALTTQAIKLLGTVSYGFSALTLAGGVITVESNLSVGTDGFGVINVYGGSLFVTNTNASASINSQGYHLYLTQTNGSITADTLDLADGSAYTWNFLGGTLTTKGTTINDGQLFKVGNGTNQAIFLLNGGFHSFNNGLLIASNALLTGCGNISGSVTNQGMIAFTCSTVFSNAVVNNATLIVSNGAMADFYGPVINNGLINSINGTVNFHSTFVNHGIYLTTNGTSNFQITSVTPLGDDMLIAWQAGGGETNVVQATADLTVGYSNISPNISLLGTGLVFTNYLDLGGATNSASRFYRVLFVP